MASGRIQQRLLLERLPSFKQAQQRRRESQPNPDTLKPMHQVERLTSLTPRSELVSLSFVYAVEVRRNLETLGVFSFALMMTLKR
jgi:hypothetical protein